MYKSQWKSQRRAPLIFDGEILNFQKLHMKRILLLSLTMLFASFCHAQSMKDFEWLLGKWERSNTQPGSEAFELWEWNDATLTGTGLTLQGTDTVFVEHLQLLKQADEFYYVADVAHNQEPTYFRITQVGKQQFTCSNPSHDFPKQISYELEGNMLKVVISGNGRSIPFIFNKSY